MNNDFSTEGFSLHVTKPWGEEFVYTPPGLERAGKVLRVQAGKKLSFQYHDDKEETICLIEGEALFWLENAAGEIEKVPMVPMTGYTVRRNQKHRVEAVLDSVLIEVSSPERGTTVRLEDDFARTDETEAMRARENRGWQQD